MKKILVIEDEPQIRENIQEILQLSNFDAISAPNGVEGLELAQHQMPDLIICDIMMPELDGFSVLQALRHIRSTANIPLIFLTAKSERASLRQGMEFGANDYLTKPFEPDELIRAIQVQLERQERLDQRVQSRLNELCNSITLSLPHELHTPLNGILGMSELMIDEPEGMSVEERLEIAQAIRESALRLHRLTQNFLLYAELEIAARDKTRIQRWQSQPATSFAKSAIAEVAQQKAKQVFRLLDLKLELQDAPLPILEAHLRKIIEELVDNAFKFSSQGTPVQIFSDVDADGYHLQVIDQGRGMTPAQIASSRAYLQFERKLYEQQGSGLGLTIVKRLVELYEGSLSIQSKFGDRTCVYIDLPKAKNI
jgi:two-component system, sensor histidine kinase and response regulator